MRTKLYKISGFTLSEVLLVLSVIGVVAALTIPTLINNISKDQYVSKLKKNYSVFSQAFNMLLADNGGDISPVFTNADTGANAMNAFASKLNVIKNCASGTGCWYDTSQKFLNGSQNSAAFDSSIASNYGKVILADGTELVLNDFAGVCISDNGDGPLDSKVCGTVALDVNGNSPPNTRGRDFFIFWITTTGVYPKGIYNDTFTCGVGSDYATSDGCTAKVLTEGAMNY